MEELAEAAEAQQPNDQKEVAPSHRLYHVWTTRRNDLQLPTAVQVLETLLPKARKLVERADNGGTDASLGLVMFCLVPQVFTHVHTPDINTLVCHTLTGAALLAPPPLSIYFPKAAQAVRGTTVSGSARILDRIRLPVRLQLSGSHGSRHTPDINTLHARSR